MNTMQPLFVVMKFIYKIWCVNKERLSNLIREFITFVQKEKNRIYHILLLEWFGLNTWYNSPLPPPPSTLCSFSKDKNDTYEDDDVVSLENVECWCIEVVGEHDDAVVNFLWGGDRHRPLLRFRRIFSYDDTIVKVLSCKVEVMTLRLTMLTVNIMTK